MKKIYTCKSCGKVLRKPEDFAGNEIGNPYCKECGDEFGHRKNFSQIIKDTKESIIKEMAISEREAEKIAEENISNIPFWINKDMDLKNYKKIIITDVGSTTTKALLLSQKENSFYPSHLADAITTVELPTENVNIGIFKAVKKIEKESGEKLLSEEATAEKLIFNQDCLYLTTSSAGGGLQILVIGLTLFDSASSGERTAYGAGGVILDTFAIDDKRSSLEQMREMKILHPDIILMAGGINGGAISPLLRLGELLQMARPTPKFGTKNQIPLIFAGNESAQPLISSLFGERFELYLTENLRPTMQDENLEPARQKIHHLFMENVMEQAPGYSDLKLAVSDDIIPTPLGVIKSLQLLSNEKNANIMSIDIGGATTDIFSNILGQYFRTVSANYGMSYSISNVMKDATIDNILTWIPKKITTNQVRNYISNKMLYPGYIPNSFSDRLIELAIAREAIKMSKKQHLKMNFKTSQIGFLDKLTKSRRDLEKITEAFYLDQILEKKKFHMHEINILIGAGGAISHASTKEEALFIIYDGLEAQGITEIWQDRDFITPHLGKLSSINEKLAIQLLNEQCFDKLATTIRPIAKKWKSGMKVMDVKISTSKEEKQLEIKTEELIYINDKIKKKITIDLHKGFYLNDEEGPIILTCDHPLLIDTRIESNIDKELPILQPMNEEIAESSRVNIFKEYVSKKTIETGDFKMKISLPYPGNILVEKGQKVTPDTIIGENLYDPPKIYVISLFDKTYLRLNENNLEESLLINEGEEVKYGQRIVEVGRKSLLEELQFQHYYFESPVRGRVEKINIQAGTIIMREIQDYSTKPRKVNIAKKLSIEPKMVKRYMKRSVGDFVYAGDALASRILDITGGEFPMIVSAPSTGTITDLDEKGIATITYDKKPYRLYSGLTARVTDIEENLGVELSYRGKQLNGIIGFGSRNDGKLAILNDRRNWQHIETGSIIVYHKKADLSFLKAAQKYGVNGIIIPSIDNQDLVNFLGKEIGVALTGNESIPFTIIITEGFGDFDMDTDYEEFFANVENRWAFVNGHTQIRAGVVRPMIIVTE